MKRQAMIITTKELRRLADDLDKEAMYNMRYLIPTEFIQTLKWSISIVNKQPKCSDTWRIEYGIKKIKNKS